MMEGDGEGGAIIHTQAVTPAGTHSRSQAVTRNHKAKKKQKKSKEKKQKRVKQKHQNYLGRGWGMGDYARII